MGDETWKEEKTFHGRSISGSDSRRKSPKKHKEKRGKMLFTLSLSPPKSENETQFLTSRTDVGRR